MFASSLSAQSQVDRKRMLDHARECESFLCRLSAESLQNLRVRSLGSVQDAVRALQRSE